MTVEQALKILRDHGVPKNVVRHAWAVAVVAHHLARRLQGRGFVVDAQRVRLGALLHDLDKLAEGEHGRQAGRWLRDLGFPELAPLVERHVLHTWPDTPLQTWEEKLVHYADKVVEGWRVVGLRPRLEALRRRYPRYAHEIEAAEPFLLALEQELAQALGVSHEELARELEGLDTRLPAEVEATYDAPEVSDP